MQKVQVDQRYLLIRYRTIMILIGILYPLWRMVAHLTIPEQDETWLDRDLISIIFLVFGLLTYQSEYFRKNVSVYFNIIIYIWFLQVFYLMVIHHFTQEYLLLGIVVIFSSGSSFLDANQMLYYYLFCILFTGGAMVYRHDLESLSFFAGVVVAIAVSYAGLRSLMRLFYDLDQGKKLIQKKNEEFMELSAAVQTLFLPAKKYHETSKWSIAGFYRPVDGCGGDWWSYSENGGILNLVLGDVTGHGPGSAMMTASIASYMHAIENESPNLTVPEMLRALNEYLLQLQGERKAGVHLMTLCAIQVDLQNNILRSWSAGAPSGYLLKPGQNFESVGSRGSPLGVGSELGLGYDEHTIQPGDRLFVFTDGIVEAQVGERQFGERRLLKLVEAAADKSPVDVASSIEKSVDTLVVESQQDDYTFVVLDFK